MLPLNDFLTLGERLDVDLDGNSYRSMLQDIIGADVLCISQITRRNIPVYVPMDTVLPIHFLRENGLFMFQARLIGFDEMNKVRFLRLRMVSEPVKHQRRNAYRLKDRLNVSVRVTSLLLDSNQITQFESRTIDISEGGLCVEARQAYPDGTLLEVEVMMEEGANFKARGEVARCTFPENRQDTYKIGVRFVNMDVRIQRRLAKYIIEKQILLRQRL